MKQQILILLLFALCSLLAEAQIPRTLSYQGVLTDSSGTPRVDASYNFTFSLYDSGSGGAMLWNEAKSLATKRGLFSTALGDATPFPDSLKFDRPYWLNISVSSIGELSPRVALMSVGYSMNALRADTAKYAEGMQSARDLILGNNINGEKFILHTRSGSHGDFIQLTCDKSDGEWDFGKGITFQRSTGNIGIGTTNPISKLTVYNTAAGGHMVLAADDNSAADETRIDLDFQISNTGHTVGRVGSFYKDSRDGGYGGLRFFTRNAGSLAERLRITEIGDIITGRNLNGSRFIIHSRGNTNDFLQITGDDPSGNWEWNKGITFVRSSGNVGIGTSAPSERLEVAGRIKTQVLEITGGSDLAEPFEMSHEQVLEPGSVVIIDDEHPGQLKLSDRAYDRRVAGVVSGAGGIKPGLTLNQTELTKTGQNVALSGRVYVKATVSNGAISPGDLLTTSDILGLAMRASDDAIRPGMTIGKAMSSLNKGEGLVLVLVNLQ